MNKENIINKIKKMSGVIAVILKICQIACYIGIGFLVATMIYAGICNGLDSVAINSHITLKAPLSKEWLQELDLTHIMIICILMIIKQALYLAVFIIAGRIFDEVRKKNTPFEIQHVKRMRTIALLILLANIFTFTGERAGISFDLNITGIVSAFIIWGLSYIFEYGCRLQLESDETL